MNTVRTYLGLGTNLGDREANLREAVRRLRELGTVVRQSKVLESAPWGYTDQPDFLNMVVALDTILPPLDLLRAVKAIESIMGRVPAVRYGPRLIDIDLLLYGDVTMDTPELTLPHPRMGERDFVMVPLRELGVGSQELVTRPASEA
ncbi:MAG TPA: 2-amino-4-hydroxy-6-hydroxymethyldihydropteridine diphosphokinase [Armatimonadota bacterium]|jgi:2-amino-4-hydroxy-6-hydroxymethyldihydropteridine diphosphokinase